MRQARAAAKVAERDASSRGTVVVDLKLKPKILILTRSFLPGYRGGGHLRTIANMAEQLSEELDFTIITSDRDFGDIAPSAFSRKYARASVTRELAKDILSIADARR